MNDLVKRRNYFNSRNGFLFSPNIKKIFGRNSETILSIILATRRALRNIVTPYYDSKNHFSKSDYLDFYSSLLHRSTYKDIDTYFLHKYLPTDIGRLGTSEADSLKIFRSVRAPSQLSRMAFSQLWKGCDGALTDLKFYRTGLRSLSYGPLSLQLQRQRCSSLEHFFKEEIFLLPKALC
jgi:hypothetical protein